MLVRVTLLWKRRDENGCRIWPWVSVVWRVDASEGTVIRNRVGEEMDYGEKSGGSRREGTAVKNVRNKGVPLLLRLG